LIFPSSRLAHSGECNSPAYEMISAFNALQAVGCRMLDYGAGKKRSYILYVPAHR
jgi:hypothetical protein